MKDSKEKILANIKEALKKPALTPAEIYGLHHQEKPEPYSIDFREKMPFGGNTLDESLEIYKKNLLGLGGQYFECSSFENAREQIITFLKNKNLNKIATQHGEICDKVVPTKTTPIYANDIDPIYTDSNYDRFSLEKADVSIAECEYLIAQTGSVMFSTRASGGRALTVLPPISIILARKSQIVPDMTEAYKLFLEKYDGDLPDAFGFISGPSRTGDIERILVIGVHGPKELYVFIIDE